MIWINFGVVNRQYINIIHVHIIVVVVIVVVNPPFNPIQSRSTTNNGEESVSCCIRKLQTFLDCTFRSVHVTQYGSCQNQHLQNNFSSQLNKSLNNTTCQMMWNWLSYLTKALVIMTRMVVDISSRQHLTMVV